MNQRRVGIFMILWDNQFSRDQFELCQKYYQQAIEKWNMPVDVYGVEYYVGSEDRVQDNKIQLACSTEYIMEFRDEDTILKWMDLMLSPAMPKYDVYVRLTPSSVLNLVELNNLIQSNEYDPDTVYTGIMLKQMIYDELEGNLLYETIQPRGNLVVMSENMVQEMKQTFLSKPLDKIVQDSAGIFDDQVIGAILFKYYGHKYKALGFQVVNEFGYDRLGVPAIYNTMLVGCKLKHNRSLSDGVFQRYQDVQTYMLSVMEFILQLWDEYHSTHSNSSLIFEGPEFPMVDWKNTQDGITKLLKRRGWMEPDNYKGPRLFGIFDSQLTSDCKRWRLRKNNWRK